MQRRPKFYRPNRSEAEVMADAAACRKLFMYLREETGRQKRLGDATGIGTAGLSRIANGAPISAETAIVLHVATKGELKAWDLCPSRAELLHQFIALA